MASGIKDKVAIVGMGCTTFGEHWDRGSGGPHRRRIRGGGGRREDRALTTYEAAWMGNALDDINVGNSAIPLALRCG